MSDFFQFEADLRKDSSESILVIGDPDQVYGDSWLVCLTEGAQEREMGKMLEAERAAAALEEEIRLERERVEAQQRAAENAVYEDVPIWAVTKLHGAFKVQFLCAQRGAGMLLNISAKFWRNSRPA